LKQKCRKHRNAVSEGAGKFWGVAKDFCPNFPKLAQKKPKEIELKGKTTALVAFFQINALQAPFLPKFPLTRWTSSK